MAKVTGPLHSASATGTFARLITFQHRTATPSAHLARLDAPPVTEAQTAHRARVAAIAATWRGKTLEQKREFCASQRCDMQAAWPLYCTAQLRNVTTTQWDGGSSIWDAGSSIWLP